MSKIPPIPQLSSCGDYVTRQKRANQHSLSLPTVAVGTWLGNPYRGKKTLQPIGVYEVNRPRINRHTQFALALTISFLMGILGQNLFQPTDDLIVVAFMFACFVLEWFAISLICLISERW